jgi:endonuclease-3
MLDADIHDVMSILKSSMGKWQSPAVTIISQRHNDPFKVLVSCILSLRTKDKVTGEASERLFAKASTPAMLAAVTEQVIEHLIYPVGFYRTKAKQIRAICIKLVEDYGGAVPDDIDSLMQFKGVGRKTANLVVSLGHGKPGICVDVHVHRICNRWGYVKTSHPDETEFVLRAMLPREYWFVINDYLVTFGQNQCKPVSPFCSTCPLASYCVRQGVVKFR